MNIISEIKNRSKQIRAFIGFAISAVLLWLTFHKSGIELQKLVLNSTQWLFFIAAVCSFLMAVWIQSIRLKLFWVDEKRKFNDIMSLSSLFIGNFYNCVLPGNLGEGIRAWHFSEKNNVRFSRSLAAILAEKWIDALIFVPVVAILFIIRPLGRNLISFAIIITVMVILGLFAVYIAMRNHRRFEKALWMIVLSFKKPGRFLYRLYMHTIQHIENLKKRGLIVHYVVLCFVMFFLNALQFYLLLKCAEVAPPVNSAYTALLIGVSVMVIVFIPSAPSNIGVLHYGLYSVLLLAASEYNIIPDNMCLQSYALFAISVHLSYFIPEILIGAFFLIKERKVLFYK